MKTELQLVFQLPTERRGHQESGVSVSFLLPAWIPESLYCMRVSSDALKTCVTDSKNMATVVKKGNQVPTCLMQKYSEKAI